MAAPMEVDTDRCLDRAYEVLERLRDCGLAPCELSDEAALLSRSPAGVHVRASAAALAAALLALSPPLLGAPEPLQAAAAAVRATAADDLSAADGALEHALAGLLGALDPQDQAAPQTERAELFDALLARLQAGRMLAARAKAAAASGAEADAASTRAVQLSPAAARRASDALRQALAALLPGDADAAQALAARDGGAAARALARGASQLLATLPSGFLEPLCPPGSLSAHQLGVLRALNQELGREYAMRRQMLILRADCTLASLLTSNRTSHAATKAEAQRAIAPEREAMNAEVCVAAEEVFSVCRADLAALARKTSTQEERHAQASVKRVRIGAVPDRGGRTEGRADPSMPAFMPRVEGAAGNGGAGRGRGRGARGDGERKRKHSAQQAVPQAAALPDAQPAAPAPKSVSWKPKPKPAATATDAPAA